MFREPINECFFFFPVVFLCCVTDLLELLDNRVVKVCEGMGDAYPTLLE